MNNNTPENNLLEVKNLEIRFGKNSDFVLSDFNFSIKKGETLGIVGESGSGKSITSYAIINLLSFSGGQVTKGEIWYNSPTLGKIDLNKITPHQARLLRGKEITMIFQEPMSSLNPVFTCGQQVEEVVINHHPKKTKEETKQLVTELFEKVKLPTPETTFDKYPHELSGGQKQRVMIAMAIILKPTLLIADEPTTALDVTVQKEILHLLNELKHEMNAAILFISHDLGVIADLADQVMVVKKGKMEEIGEKMEVFTNPKSPYTKGLLACRPTLETNNYRLPTVQEFLKNEERTDFRTKELFIGKEPILEVKDLCVRFDKTTGFFKKKTESFTAVDNVSFTAYKGETLGLVGESGCGKSTLSRAILNLIPPTSGSVLFEGKDITHPSEQEKRAIKNDIQIILQDPYSSLNPRLTIGSAIEEAMMVHKIGTSSSERKEILRDLFNKVDLNPDFIQRYPHEFSGGQRQRISIARSLALNPKLIICDESVSALDVSVQAQVLNLLNDLKEEFNFTYIFISHDLSVVKYMSDRILVMKNGKIVEQGDPNTIYHHPKNNYTQTLIEAIPSIHPTMDN